RLWRSCPPTPAPISRGSRSWSARRSTSSLQVPTVTRPLSSGRFSKLYAVLKKASRGALFLWLMKMSLRALGGSSTSSYQSWPAPPLLGGWHRTCGQLRRYVWARSVLDGAGRLPLANTHTSAKGISPGRFEHQLVPELAGAAAAGGWHRTCG